MPVALIHASTVFKRAIGRGNVVAAELALGAATSPRALAASAPLTTSPSSRATDGAADAEDGTADATAPMVRI